MVERKKIVFSTDFSDASLVALPWARQMSEKFDAEVHCVTAVQELVAYTPMMAVPAALPPVEELSRHAEARLDDFVRENIGALSQPIVKKVLQGRPADEIVRYADAIGATMIIIATHGRSGAAHLIMGSTAEGVLRHAKCPVLSVRAQQN